MDQVKICEGLSDISDSYGGFLIDQWGTLHDGRALFPDTLDALKHLKDRGKQIILVSNSGKRAQDDQARLAAMGLSESLYDHSVTSTEVMWQGLKDRHTQGLLRDVAVGDRCYLISRGQDTHGLDDIDDLTLVDDIESADFILLTGSDAPEKTLEADYDPLLKKASRQQIKMICANPMKTMTVGSAVQMGSGAIAARYAEFGGVVTSIGKPFPSIFQYAMTLFDDLYPSQICVIGDSLHYDVRGAQYLDMDCALIANGVHKGSFSKVQNRADIHKMLTILKKNYGAEPTYFIPKFHWGKPLPDRKNKRKRER